MRRLFEGSVDSRAAFNRVITVAILETFTVSYDDLRVRMGPSSFAHARTSRFWQDLLLVFCRSEKVVGEGSECPKTGFSGHSLPSY